MESLNITSKPPAFDQVRVFGDSLLGVQSPVGIFVCTQSQIIGGNQFGAFGAGFEPVKPFEVNLDVIEEFTVHMVPTFNPMLLLCFSDKNDASVKSGSGLQFLYCCGFEVIAAGAPGPVAAINAGVKFVTGQNFFGPQKLPGNFKFFRAYQINFDQAGPGRTQRNLQSDITVPTLQNMTITMATVTFMGR